MNNCRHTSKHLCSELRCDFPSLVREDSAAKYDLQNIHGEAQETDWSNLQRWDMLQRKTIPVSCRAEVW